MRAPEPHLTDEQKELDAVLRGIERKLPPFAKGLPRLIRHPPPFYIRLPLGLALVIGGIFSILPILGVWMLPLGLLLLARDSRFVCRHATWMLRWVEKKLPEKE